MATTATTTDTRTPAAPEHNARPARRLGWVCLAIVLTTTVLVGAGLYLRDAWQAAALREAYLPELEERARREIGNGPLLALLAARRCEAGQYGAGAMRWEQAAIAGERGALLWRTWAATLAATGDFVKARAALQLGIARDPEARGELTAALAKMEAAPGSAFAVAEAIFPDGIRQASRHYSRGSFWNGFRAAQGRRDPERSGFATRQEWAQSEPENATALRLWGEALIINERYPEAEAVLQKVALLLPGDATIQAALGDALRGQNRAADAGRAYQRSLALAKDNRRALLGAGRVMLDRNLIRLAVPIFFQATRLYPEDADVWIGMGEAHYAQRVNFGGAVTAFERARKLAPTRTDYFNVYSNALRASGRYDDAEAVLNERLAAVPEDVRAHYLIALLLLDFQATAERRTRAEGHLREALRLEPRSPTVQGRLGKLLADTGRAAEAIPLLQGALRADNKNIAYLRALADAHRQTGEAQEAQAVMESLRDVTTYNAQVQALQDAQMLRPADVTVHQKLADLLERGGEMEKARFHREVIKMLKTRPDLAKRSLSELRDAMARIVAQ